MEERKFVDFRKGEYRVKEYIKQALGMGKISRIKLEYTPVGEKIIVLTDKPGYIIGKQGAKINELTTKLKRNFKMENPHIEIADLGNPDLDSQTVADEIALGLERFGNVRFKAIAYKYMVRIMGAGALGVEMRISGKLPGERAKTWRFAQGYLKKTGDPARLVDKARAVAKTKTGIIGIKVSILPPNVVIEDQIIITEEMKNKLKANADALALIPVKKEKKVAKKKVEKAKSEEIAEDNNDGSTQE
jgi:small subunit ribosomal protein S3